MKNKLVLILAAGVLAIMHLGCSSAKQTENLLSAAGFKIMPAASPQQQAHLKTLPPHKVTVVVREGKTYFVFPDAKQQVLYVGQQAQYDAYQKLRVQQQLAEDKVQAAEMNSEAAWGVWGGFGPVMAVPVYRR